jgi:hypothetical protein
VIRLMTHQINHDQRIELRVPRTTDGDDRDVFGLGNNDTILNRELTW